MVYNNWVKYLRKWVKKNSKYVIFGPNRALNQEWSCNRGGIQNVKCGNPSNPCLAQIW